MKVLRFTEWLNESLNNVNEDTGNHSYGCAMLFFNFPAITEIHEEIKEDIYVDENSERGFGLETDPHVTLLYGLHSDEIEDDEVIKICKSENISELVLYNVSTFENEKYDVLKFDVRYNVKGGAFLHKINSKLSKLPNTNSYPEYHPHVTIAYLKSGTADKYVEKFKDLEYIILPEKIVYSKADNTEIEEKLK